MNDDHRWSREQIASFVEEIERRADAVGTPHETATGQAVGHG